MRILRTFFLLGLIVFIGRPQKAIASPEQIQTSIVLTSQENGLQSQSTFKCYGKIHGYIRLAKREKGVHILESRWISPTHKIANESRSTVDFRPARSTAYVWFSFPENGGLLGQIDPELDQLRLSYDGRWHLEVLWDGAQILQSDFQVHCP